METKTGSVAADHVETHSKRQVSLGDSGTLLEIWHDWEGVALLRMMAGMPDAADRRGGRGRLIGAEGRFGWLRDPGRPEKLMLNRTLFGVRVFGSNPEQLADGIEYLAQWLDRLLVEVEYQNARIGQSIPIEQALSQAMRRHFALRPSGAPIGTDFRPEDEDQIMSPRLTLDDIYGRKLDEIRAKIREPEIQDHRAIIPPQRK